MFEISKDFGFSASHVLEGLSPGHRCGRLHGHNYTVRVILDCPSLNGAGFVVDYGDLNPFRAWVDETLDHRHLNDVVDFNPTAELLARHLAGVVRDLVPLAPGTGVAVGVSETPKTWATWRES